MFLNTIWNHKEDFDKQSTKITKCLPVYQLQGSLQGAEKDTKVRRFVMEQDTNNFLHYLHSCMSVKGGGGQNPCPLRKFLWKGGKYLKFDEKIIFEHTKKKTCGLPRKRCWMVIQLYGGHRGQVLNPLYFKLLVFKGKNTW